MDYREHFYQMADAIADEGGTTNREQWRKVAKLSHKEFDRYLARLYAKGYADGAKAMQGQIEREAPEQFEWETIMDVIMSVDGVGEKIGGRINAAVQEAFG